MHTKKQALGVKIDPFDVPEQWQKENSNSYKL